MKKLTALQKAKNIVTIVKSVNKGKEYAKDIVSWYCMTDREDREVIEHIENIWDNYINKP